MTPVWLTLYSMTWPATLAQAGGVPATAQRVDPVPGVHATAEQFPEADAVIVLLEQSWTLDPDGALRYRELRRTKVLERRAIRRLADPRITFCEGPEQLTVTRARTIKTDGSVVPVPAYAFNIAAANDVAGWPEYTCFQDQVVSFSAVEPDVVLELDYETTTAAATQPWVSADINLQERDPVVERRLSVTVPKGQAFHHRLDNTEVRAQTHVTNGTTTYSWRFTDLPSNNSEPLAPSWQQSCPRLRWTTCPNAEAWVGTIAATVEQAAAPGPAIRGLVEQAISAENDPAQQVIAVHEKLAKVFNYVTSDKTLRSWRCRDAEQVFRSNYGSPLESAALLLAGLRAAGLRTDLRLAVHTLDWHEQVPVDSSFAAAIVVVDVPGGPVTLHPQHGQFANPGGWGRHTLLAVGDDGTVKKTRVYARGENGTSEFTTTGKLALAPDGRVTGEIRWRLSGSFYDPARLKTTADQKSFIENLTAGILKEMNVTKHSITTLSDDLLQATAQVSSKATLQAMGDHHLLQFSDLPPAFHSMSLPLQRSRRRSPVQLPGSFLERLDLLIELPESWNAGPRPTSAVHADGSWGSFSQEVVAQGRTLVLRRSVAVRKELLTPQEFLELRQALNAVRSPRNTNLLLGPA